MRLRYRVSPHNPTFPQAVGKAQTNDIHLAISNPAFEFWFLLHFVDTTKVLTYASQLRNDLGKYLPNYGKNVDYLSQLLGRTEGAIRHADKIQRTLVSGSDPYPHPSTTVHLLVGVINGMRRR